MLQSSVSFKVPSENLKGGWLTVKPVFFFFPTCIFVIHKKRKRQGISAVTIKTFIDNSRFFQAPFFCNSFSEWGGQAGNEITPRRFDDLKPLFFATVSANGAVSQATRSHRDDLTISSPYFLQQFQRMGRSVRQRITPRRFDDFKPFFFATVSANGAVSQARDHTATLFGFRSPVIRKKVIAKKRYTLTPLSQHISTIRSLTN